MNWVKEIHDVFFGLLSSSAHPDSYGFATAQCFVPAGWDQRAFKSALEGIGRRFSFIQHIGIGMNVWEAPNIELKLLLKRPDDEKNGRQFTLPTPFEGLGMAERDLAGVEKCAMFVAGEAYVKVRQPLVIGVGVSADRATTYGLADRQLYRLLRPAPHDQTEVAAIERRVGEMESVDACFVGIENRHPGCFFVSVVAHHAPLVAAKHWPAE